MIPKFRAWHKKEKKIYHVVGINFDYGEVFVERAEHKKKTNTCGCCDDRRDTWFKLEDVILMQSTGLNDKNGKEIFEGDVVKAICTDKTEYILKIVFDQIMWAGDNMNGDLEVLDDFGNYPNYNLEVIGNIHENPELLEANK